MKNLFKFKWLLLSIVLSIASINTAWAGDLCGFCDKAEITDAVYIKYSKNGGSATQQNLAGSGQGDITLGTVTSLTITEFRGITKKHNGNVCAVRLYYKTATTGDIEIGSDNYKSAEYNNSGYPDWTWDSWWLCEQYKNSSVGLNILNGLAPGSYWFNFYFSIYGNNNSNSGCWDHQAYWSNGSKNYHMSFTVPSKNLTVAGAVNGNTVSGDQTGISSGTAYTITATPAPGYKFNGWTATSGSSSISIADASSATTTVTFNNYANDATVTASFVRTYAFIEGRFHVWNESRSGAWTNSFGNNEDWSHVSTNIQFEYNPTDHLFYRHTYATPAELTSQISNHNPYFYVKTSTSTDDVTTHYAACYWSSTDQTLSSAGTKLSLIHDGSLDDDNLRFNNSLDNTGYVVLYFNESKIWYELEQTLTYNGNGNTAGSAPSGTYVERTKSVTAASKPGALAKSGYDFGGWNEANDGSGTNYTAGSSSITMGSTNKTVYSKWTQDVTLHDNNGEAHNGSMTATWNAAGPFSITAPTKTGYSVEGYYAEVGCTNKVLTDEGAIADESVEDGSSVTFISDSKWAHAAATTLYTKWTEDLHSVTVAAGDNGSIGDNVDEVTGVGIATASSSITAVPNEGYHFDSWTLPGDGSVTIASGSGTATITINATADSKTITANFAANTYAVKFNANYPSGNRFNNGATMSNQDFTYDAAQNLTANAFACEGYTFIGWATTSDGSVAHTDKKSVSNLTTTNGGTVNLYAVWEDDNIYYFDGGTSGTSSDWETNANWTKGKAPSSLADHEVRLLKHADIDNSTGTVHVKSVRIYMNGSYTPTGGSEITVSEYGGYLYIWSRGALVVQNDILNYDMSTDTESPTTWRSLQIWADQYGSGALIVGDHQEGNQADVTFYTKACYGGTAGSYVNQFFGIPYTSSSPHNYYGVYLYKYNLNAETYAQSFDPASSGTMTPFTAYLMLRTDLTPGYCYTDGELILPGTGDGSSQDLDLVYSSEKKVSNMFANSWMGPIDLRAMDTEGGSNDFVGVEATFYMFNAGSSNDVGENASEGNSPGQWTVLPVNAVKTDAADGTMDTYAQCVIPSQQAFLVVATQSGTTHQLKLDYKKHVYDPFEDNDVTIVPTRAPRREGFVLPEQMDLYVTGESGNSDRVIIYAREDFSTGFDNGWEGYKITGSAFAPQMYTLSDNGEMAINAIPDVEGSVIGFKPGTEDTQYTFTFKYSGENTWYLNDLKEQTSTQIDELDSYTFTSAEGDMEARFIISRTPIAHTPTAIENGGAIEGVSVRKLMIDGTLYIIRDGRMYNSEGALVK